MSDRDKDPAADGSDTEFCKKDCAYYSDKTSVECLRWIFITVIFVSIGLVIWHNCYLNNKFEEGYAMIVSQHKDFCANTIDFQKSVLHNDSVLAVDNSMLHAIREENTAITNQLELMYQRISDNFSGITLWASALMIVFLIFSIYAMYRIDEMQQQGRETLTKIYDLHRRSQDQFNSVKKWFETEQAKIEKEAGTKVKVLEKRVNTITEKADTKVGDLEKEIESVHKKATEAGNKFKKVHSDLETLSQKTDEKIKNSEDVKDELDNHIRELEAKLSGTVNEEIRKIQEVADRIKEEMNVLPSTADLSSDTKVAKYKEAFDEINEKATPETLTENQESPEDNR